MVAQTYMRACVVVSAWMDGMQLDVCFGFFAKGMKSAFCWQCNHSLPQTSWDSALQCSNRGSSAMIKVYACLCITCDLQKGFLAFANLDCFHGLSIALPLRQAPGRSSSAWGLLARRSQRRWRMGCLGVFFWHTLSGFVAFS